jgi:hypothetical protein
MWCCVENDKFSLVCETGEEEIESDDDIPSLWQQASQWWTTAAFFLTKYKDLQAEGLSKDATDAYDNGMKRYLEGCKIIEQLSPEDLDKFWSVQKRNKGVSKFEQLITHTQYFKDQEK